MTTVAQDRQHVFPKTACLLMLSLYWFFTTYSSAPSNFSYTDVLYVFSLVGVGLIIQTGFALALGRHWQVNVLLGFFASFNVISLYLALNFSFLTLGTASQLGICAAAWLLATLFFFSFAGSKVWRTSIVLVVLLLLVSVVATTLANHLAPDPLLESPAQGETASPNVKIVEFQRKPNIYFISWDALAPEVAVQELLELPSVEYDDVLVNQGFVLLRNHFTDSSDTLTSLNQLMALDPEYYHAIRRGSKKQYNIITGRTPGPLLEILKSNGYVTHLYHRNFALGTDTGPYLDFYETRSVLTACSQFQSLRNTVAFFGYCLWLGVPSDSVGDLGVDAELTVQFMIDKITAHLERDPGPHFVLANIISPYHVPVDYDGSPEDYEEYREFFARSSIRTAAYIDLLANFLKEKDPGAIMFFFADHGIKTTANWTQDDYFVDDDSLRHYVLDRFGGLASYYAADECTQHLGQDDYSITSRVARKIIQCLAGGEDPFINEPEYQLREAYLHGVSLGNSYKDFLYE